MIKKYVRFSLAYNIVISLVAATLPLHNVKLNGVFILLLLVVWLAEGELKKKVKDIFRNPFFIPLVSYFFICFLSVLYSSDKAFALSSVETIISLLLFPIILLSSIKGKNLNIDLILRVFLISCLVISLVCFITTVYHNQILGIEYSYLNSWRYSSDNLVEKWGFHPSYFSMYCAFCVFITISFVKRKILPIWIATFVIAFFLIFQTLLASRVGILSLLIVFIGTLLYEAFTRKKILLGLILSGIIFLGSIAILYSSGTMKDKINAMIGYNVNQYNEAFGFNVRLEEWKASWEILSNNLFLGVGVGDRKEELAMVYERNGFTQGYENRYDSHNLFLDTGVSMGLVGLISVIAVLVASFTVAIKNKHILYFQFLMLFLFLSFVESSFSVQKGVVFFALMNTLFIDSLKGIKINSQKV